MRNADTLENVLITRHRNEHDDRAPMLKDFPNTVMFLKAHRAWLQELRLENKQALGKIFTVMKQNQGVPFLFSYLSGVIHIRKEYDRFLVRGLTAAANHIEKYGDL